MTRHILFFYDLFRGDDVLFEGESTLDLSDQKIREVADYIRKGHTSGDFMDIPDQVAEKFLEKMSIEIQKDVKREGIEIDGSEVVQIQEVLPAVLLKYLPDDVLSMIDMKPIYDYYQADSLEAILKDLGEE